MSSIDQSMTFSPLRGTRHRFVLRHPEIAVEAERAEALARLAAWHTEMIRAMGVAPAALRTCEQVHGAGLAIAEAGGPLIYPEVDGLITQDPEVLLGIYVADCCAVYLYDEPTQTIGLLHSGKKGSELGITQRAIELMQERFAVNPATLVVQLSPCIRPPAYEVDFAAAIREQCLKAGVPKANVYDEGLCTSSDLSRYYSYRLEKGRTGRMLALLGLEAGAHSASRAA